MTVKDGSIVVHGNAKIRGTMGGATGTFSGRFSADTINAVEAINIRDGAVSTYYHFQPPKADNMDFSFALPAQKEDAIYIITLPVVFNSDYRIDYEPR